MSTHTAQTVAANPITQMQSESAGPLAGIVVADFGRVLAAPYCTMLLADLGATVIKIEGPAGDETRTWRPPVHGDDSTYYLSINRNKFDIQLDLRDPDDLQVAHRILKRADVMVDNFRPGTLDRLGLGYEQLQEINPDLIAASVTGFGEDGGSDLPGYDILAQGASGMMHITGAPDTDPFRSGIAIFDVLTGLHTCIGILGALLDRERHQRTHRISTNLLSVALSSMVNQTGAAAITGHSPNRMGNEHPSIYPYAPFPTADGRLIIAVGNDRQFRQLCSALEVPEWAEDPRFAQAADRNTHRAELKPLLEEVLRTRTTDELFATLRAADVPCGPINDVPAGLRFAESLGLNPVQYVGEGDRRVATVSNPVRYSGFDVHYRIAPPRADEHRAAVLDWLETPETDPAA